MSKNPPLSLILESARKDMIKATNEIMRTYGLPSSLMDGVICGILAEIRAQSAAQLVIDLEQQNSDSGAKDGEPDG